MTLMRFDPFRELDRWTDALAGASRVRTLPMEALRRGDRFLVALDMPGVQADDMDVTVERNVVTVRGVRRPLHEEGDEVIVDERPNGEFSRQLFLGENLDVSKMAATFEYGVLTIEIPVSEESKPRKIEVSGTSAAIPKQPQTASRR